MVDYQIFISYRRDGGDALAGRLADRFSALGYKVFFDVESMRSGVFNNQILDAISTCEDVLVVLPPNSLDRCVNADDWVRQEVSFALKHNKNVIPVMMRGFEFPSSLPEDINKIRYMEGVKASSEYFDAVIERIEKMLISNSKKSYNYRLATKDYYKIKTPLFNIYKRSNSTPLGYMNVAVFTDNLRRHGNDQFHWTSPTQILEDHTLESLTDFFELTTNTSLIKWYQLYKDELDELRRKVLSLKKYSGLYFYNSALLFAMGTMISLPKDFLKSYPSAIVEVFCYFMDLPCETFGEFEKSFDKGNNGYLDFRNLLPLPFDVWPESHNCRTPNSKDRDSFDSFAILLFDFMIELSILVIDTTKDNDLTLIRTDQIRCYYKWLKKNKLYMPKEIQERIYNCL